MQEFFAFDGFLEDGDHQVHCLVVEGDRLDWTLFFPAVFDDAVEMRESARFEDLPPIVSGDQTIPIVAVPTAKQLHLFLGNRVIVFVEEVVDVFWSEVCMLCSDDEGPEGVGGEE